MELMTPDQSHSRGPTNRLARLLARYPLVSYVLLAYGWTWTYELTLYRRLLTPGYSPGYSLGAALRDLGFALGPTLAAICVTAAAQGRAGILCMVRRTVRWRVGVRWYLVVLLGAPSLLLIAILPLPGALSALRPHGGFFWLAYPAWYVVYLVGGPLGEEPGWRGFALPYLERRTGPGMGTLLLGILWSVWHLPLFFIPGTDQYAISLGAGVVGHLSGFGVFVVWVTALAIVLTWVFNNTRSSVLLAMLLHTSINAAPGALLPLLFPSLVGFGLTWVLVWIVAALLVLAATRGRLSYRHVLREADRPTPATRRNAPIDAHRSRAAHLVSQRGGAGDP